MTGLTLNIIFITIAFALLTFALAFILASAIGADKIAAEERLEELSALQNDGGDVALVKHESKRQRAKREREKKKNSNVFEKFGSAIFKELQAADIAMRPEEFLTIWIILAILPGSIIYLFTLNEILLIICIAVGIALPVVYVKSKQKNRNKKFDEQLGDALMIACSCLRSGLSFNQAMETIAKDMDAPVSTEFATAIKEMNMGIPMDDALENMGKRIKSSHLQLMISAVLVQRQTGGNLSHILETISDTIKERMKLKRQLKTATASGKMSGLIVGAMPIVLLVLFTLINYDFVKVLYTEPRGNIALAVAAGLEIMAFISVKKITTVKM